MHTKKGQAVLVAMMIVFLVFVASAAAFAAFVVSRGQISREATLAERAFYVSEAGIEDALLRVVTFQSLPASYSLDVGTDGIADITVEKPTQISRVITSTGRVEDVERKTVVRITHDASSLQFFYGIQVGELGLEMENGSGVVGNVYSNGKIDGFASNQSQIDGDAISAGFNLIEDVEITGNAQADRFDDCEIGGTAGYVTSITDCPAGSTNILTEPPPEEELPISQAQIDDWKQDAENGGTIIGYTLGSNSSDSLGPVKVVGNMTIGNNSTLTLNGTVWVTGSIAFGNGSAIRLDSSYGDLSGTLLLDGQVVVGNTVQLSGSGDPVSYLMLLSTFSSDTLAAIDVGNSSASAIFYAGSAWIDIRNNLNLKEATGKGLRLKNNSIVTYDEGLANLLFSSGPAAGWSITQWHEE